MKGRGVLGLIGQKLRPAQNQYDERGEYFLRVLREMEADPEADPDAVARMKAEVDHAKHIRETGTER